MMKLHVIQHISKSPLHQPGGLSAWPVHLTGHAVSEAMSEVVAAVAFDGYDTMLPDSARLLYFQLFSHIFIIFREAYEELCVYDVNGTSISISDDSTSLQMYILLYYIIIYYYYYYYYYYY
jgi:hypothetical protein